MKFFKNIFVLSLIMDSFNCTVVLNITQGLGNIVLNKIHEANISNQINIELQECGNHFHFPLEGDDEDRWLCFRSSDE